MSPRLASGALTFALCCSSSFSPNGSTVGFGLSCSLSRNGPAYEWEQGIEVACIAEYVPCLRPADKGEQVSCCSEEQC